MQQHWTLLKSQAVSDHRVFRVRHDLYRVEPGGPERNFVVLEAASWVNVVPLTDDGHVVLIRQYRHGVRQVSLEIPGGVIDPGEEPQAAALRELREETGYAARRIRFLGRVWPNPAIQDNCCYFYAADGCHPAGPAAPETFERIEVVLRPIADIPGLVARQEIRHGLVINALSFAGLTIPAGGEWVECGTQNARG